MPTRLSAPGPAELLQIRERLDADEDAAVAQAAALRERDRAAGRELAALAPRPLAQLMAWHHRRDARCAQPAAPFAGLILACILLGAVAGAITAFGSFFYDGGQRVNVLLILALFCVLPLLSVIGFAIAAGSRDGLAAISGGQFAVIIARVMPGRQLAKIAALAAGDGGPGISKWLLLGWSQWLGLGYGAGALCVAMGLVLFTDLAFGWSSTLELPNETLVSIVHALAWPWRAWVPQAVPDAALIEASRYFRLNTDAAHNTDPVALARWWPYVVMTMLCYGVLPRLVTLLIARWRLRAACARALLGDARVQRLLQRMNTPLVRTESLQGERTSRPSSQARIFADLPAATDWHVINWAAVPVQQSALDALLGVPRQATRISGTHAAGGARSSAQDGELIAQLAAGDARAVLVIAKSWEPPTLDLMDFITALRGALPQQAIVAVMPLAVVDGAPAAPAAAHRQTWQHALGQAQLATVHAVAVRESST